MKLDKKYPTSQPVLSIKHSIQSPPKRIKPDDPKNECSIVANQFTLQPDQVIHRSKFVH